MRVTACCGSVERLLATMSICTVSTGGKLGWLDGLVKCVKLRVVTPILAVVIGRVAPVSVTQMASVTAGVPHEPMVMVTVPPGLFTVRVSPEAPEAGKEIEVASRTCRWIVCMAKLS